MLQVGSALSVASEPLFSYQWRNTMAQLDEYDVLSVRLWA